MKPTYPILTAMVLVLANCASSQELTDSQVQFFETNIRPALIKYCYKCHSVDGESRGGLLVDTREGLLEGGDGGAAIEPGKPDESLLWESINWEGYEMPPSEKMPAKTIEHFKTWIEMGAPDPRERQLEKVKSKITKDDIQKGKLHWAFQSPKGRPDADIDSLVNAKLEAEGLQPAKPADSFTLLRRLNIDLTGLPPTPSEISAFHKSWQKNPDAAVKAKVDELLERPQYGERWGRHWLDVARYAESSGSRNISYPHAWRYRDYVIDSFNDDTPYDRFIAEQIAGDLLPVKSDEQWNENLIATGFLAIGLKHQDQKNPRKFMSDLVDEQIDTMSQAFLGLTISCSRCHDHKYDSIPIDDYYSLAGIFYSTNTYYGTARIAQNHRPSDLILLPIQDQSGSAGTNRQSMASMKERIEQLDRQMRSIRGKERRTLRNVRNRIASQLATLNPDGSAKSFAMGVQDSTSMVNANILLGGEVERPAQQVTRGFVQVMGDLNFKIENSKSSGRLELVKSLTSKSNPLTARVMANRIWMHLLGRPLVGTPNNLGFSGMEPENQELLDYLAVKFMNENWSIKSLIREIVISDTYRRSSCYNEANYAVDPDNKLLWRAHPRQLDAESLRDSMLFVSGRLKTARPQGSIIARGGGRPGSANAHSDNAHRSVYLPIVRDNVPMSLDLFDFPDPNISSAGRSDSIVPTQALFMMNSEFVSTQAQSMAAKLEAQYQTTDEQIRYAFAWVYGRPATEAELKVSAQFFNNFKPGRITATPANSGSEPRARRGKAAQGKAGGRRSGQKGVRRTKGPAVGSPVATAKNQTLAVFCQTLMASARFRILN